MVNRFSDELHSLNLIGQTDVCTFAGIIAGARCVVGNESSAIHIAAASNVLSFCIAGGGQWGRFIPYAVDIPSKKHIPIVVNKMMDCYGCKWFCKYPRTTGPVKCIGDVGIEEVWGKIKDKIPTKFNEL